MKTWRLLFVALISLLLSGCLVSFTEPIPANEAAPMPLLGEWSRRNEWGEQLVLVVRRAGPNVYKAQQYLDSVDNLPSLQEVGFTVAHHGRRWYVSAGLPQSLGSGFAILGFEVSAENELVLYNLELGRVQQELEQGNLAGELIETSQGPGVRITSPLDKVFAYLDDPANSDVFIEVARYRRVGQ